MFAINFISQRPPAIRVLSLICCALAFCVSGCQTINVKAPFPWDKDKNQPQPDKIMAVWTDAVRTETGKPSERGFGGRVFFYDDKGKTMKVEGTVYIYVFDDDLSIEEAKVPEKKFVFPAETLALRYSKCTLGHSYNFWVPLGSVQGPNRNLSLITKIELKNGGSVVSTVTRKILPGNGMPASAAQTASAAASPTGKSTAPQATAPQATASQATASKSSVAQVSYEEPANTAEQSTGDTEPRTIAAETIQLTPSFTRRLREAKNTPEVPRKSGQAAEPDAQNLPGSLPDTTPEQTPISQPPDEPATDSAPRISQAQNRPSVQPDVMTPRHQPHPGGWLSGLPPTPRSGFQTARPKLDLNSPQQLRRAAVIAQVQSENRVPAAGSAAYSDDAAGQAD